MKNLIKYEFRKTWNTKMIILGIAAFAEVAFLVSLYLNLEEINGLSIFALTMLAFGGVMFIGIQSVLTMHQDMNTRQGYMLYMTPNSCFKILGGKVLENGLSIFAAGAFFFALGALDVTLLVAHLGQLQELINVVNSFAKQLSMELPLNAEFFGLLALYFLCTWLNVVNTAYLADVVATYLLSGKKHNGWIGLLLFLVISGAMSALQQAITKGMAWQPMLIWDAVIALACAAVMYAATAFLMDRHLSV